MLIKYTIRYNIILRTLISTIKYIYNFHSKIADIVTNKKTAIQYPI